MLVGKLAPPIVSLIPAREIESLTDRAHSAGTRALTMLGR
jgi:hypothetical protein